MTIKFEITFDQGDIAMTQSATQRDTTSNSVEPGVATTLNSSQPDTVASQAQLGNSNKMKPSTRVPGKGGNIAGKHGTGGNG